MPSATAPLAAPDASLLFEAAPAALLHVGRDGHLLQANAAARALCGTAAAPGVALAALWQQPADAGTLLQAVPIERSLWLPCVGVGVGVGVGAACLQVRSQPLPDGSWVLALQPVDAPADAAAVQASVAEAQSALALALAVDLGNIAIWRHDLASNRMHYNAQAYRVLDIPARPEGLSLDAVRDLIHPDDLPQVLASAQRALREPGPTDMQARYRRADGTWRQVMTRRVLQRDDQGQPQAFIGVALDVTAQHDEQRRAAAMKHRFEQATAAAGIGFWMLEQGGEPTWNASLRDMISLPPGAPAPGFADWLRRCVHPDDQATVMQRFQAWWGSDQDSLEMSMRARRPDGSVRYLATHSRIERGPSQRAMFGVVIDLTERHSAEQALRTAEQSAALAARGAGLATWQLDLDTGHALWDARMWQLRGLEPRPDAMGEAERLACVHPEDRSQVQARQREVLAHGEPVEHEFRVIWPDGQVRWLASRSVEMTDSASGVRRRLGVNWDVTAKRHAEVAQLEREAAQASNLAKSRFLARMSHELRTPLNAVLGFAQLLLSDEPGLDAASALRSQRLAHIHAAGRHLLLLIDDVLDLSSLESGELRVALQPVPLAALVTQTLPMLGTLLERRQVQLRLGSIDGTAMADATRLSQALLNLLSNAIKYSHEGGSVSIDTERHGPVVALRVSDNGMGMTPEQVLHLFEPFNRLGRRSEGPGGTDGSGIGLAIVKALVERMGGSVAAASMPGQGSVFELRLAAAEAPGEAPAPTSAPTPAAVLPPLAAPTRSLTAPAAAVAPRGTVLYVEDNAVNSLIVTELLRRRPDLQLHVAADGASGVQRALELQPDLVLLDMHLPDMDGHEVLRRLRLHAALADVPVIALSANAMPEDIALALRAGMADYWTKPLDFTAFLAALQARFGPPPQA